MRWRPAPGFTIILTLLATTIIGKVRTNGRIELRLRNFTNENALNADGNCCDGVRTSGKCPRECRTFFRICVKHYQAEISPGPPCTYGTLETPIIGGGETHFEFPSSINASFENPVKFLFNFAWPGTFSLIIEAYHDVTLTGPAQSSPRELITRLAVHRYAKVEETWKDFIHDGGNAQLGYSYRIMCMDNYYGEQCRQVCRPRDDNLGHYTCNSDGTRRCLDGYTGTYCDKVKCLPGCSEEHAECTRPNECRCRAGWRGEFCDQCIPYPGCNETHGSCVKEWDCICHDGWGGLYCNQDLNYCTHHRPCQNGATCKNTGEGSYTCTCLPGYSGTNCEVRSQSTKDDCKENPCHNGGTCKDIGRTFQCICPEGFHGRHCESNVTSCDGFPCQNGGTCVDRLGSYLCKCGSAFTGVDCEMEADECISNPCKNGGRCVDEFDGFRCVCAFGYSGTVCEKNENDCDPNPCKNNGKCKDLNNDFECQCQPGFVGPLCEENVDDCIAQPCTNNGTCHDLDDDFRCDCPSGFFGKDCSDSVNDCGSGPCLNGGICVDKLDGYTCTCVDGFTGQNCDGLPMQQIVVVVCLGMGIPILIIIVVVVILLCRRQRTHSDEDAKRENEQNQANQAKINNKCIDTEIINAIPPSNVCIKINNELQDSKTLNSKEFIIEKPSNNKHLIKNDLNTIDEQVQKKDRLSKLEQEGSTSPSTDSKQTTSKDFHQRSSCGPVDHDAISIDIAKDSGYPSELRIKPINKEANSNTQPFHHPYREHMLATEV